MLDVEITYLIHSKALTAFVFSMKVLRVHLSIFLKIRKFSRKSLEIAQNRPKSGKIHWIGGGIPRQLIIEWGLKSVYCNHGPYL